MDRGSDDLGMSPMRLFHGQALDPFGGASRKVQLDGHCLPLDEALQGPKWSNILSRVESTSALYVGHFATATGPVGATIAELVFVEYKQRPAIVVLKPWMNCRRLMSLRISGPFQRFGDFNGTNPNLRVRAIRHFGNSERVSLFRRYRHRCRRDL